MKSRDQISVRRWAKGGGLVLPKGNMRNPHSDGTVLYLDSGGGYVNLHVIKLYRSNIHTHTHAHTSKTGKSK